MKRALLSIWRIRKLLMAVVAFALAWELLPFSAWTEVSAELAIFFGLLACALPQAMALTAQVQPTYHLTVSEADALAHKLEEQQIYWFALFLLSISGVVVLVGGKMLASTALFGPNIFIIPPAAIARTLSLPGIQIAPFFSGMLGAILILLITQMVSLGQGVVSLQRLRSEFIRGGAREEADRLRETTPSTAEYDPDPNFGQVIRPKRRPPRRTAG